jgi:hypothetical protein
VSFKRKTALAGALALGLVAALAAVSLGAGSSLHVRPTTVTAGHSVRVFGKADGCARGNRVTLISRAFRRRHEFAGLPAVYATVGRRERYSARTRIPARRHAGRYRISARCGGGNLGVSARLRVRRP